MNETAVHERGSNDGIDREADSGAMQRGAATSGRRRQTLLFVTNTPLFGGAEKHLLDLVAHLPVSEARTVVLCAGDDVFSSRLGDNTNVEVIRCSKQPTPLFGWIRHFARIRPDTVVFIQCVLSTFDCDAHIAAWLCGARRVFSVQHLIPPPRPPRVTGRSLRALAVRIAGWRVRHLLSVRLAAYLSNRTICVSNAVRRGLLREYAFDGSRTVVIQNGVDTSRCLPSSDARVAVRKRLGIDSEVPLLVCAARLSPQKAIDILLLSMAALAQRGHECRCVVLGDGPLKEELLSQVQSLGLQDRVLLAGLQKDVTPYFQAADIFVLTSRREGLPLALLEAMSCGLPCVVTDVGGNAEAVAHGETGLVVRPESVEEVTDALEHLLLSRGERISMGIRARARACGLFEMGVKMQEFTQAILD